ncbi:MAG TPA: biotin/lipoyl-binding protein, partial [Burkholderiales bacterium]|nr:biotin/lipoyl-binding protein [Burkholderiales bacterium]
MPPPPEVSVAQVVSRDVRQWDEFTGRVTAVEAVDLRPRVSGYVERVAYEEGQEVRKGDLLFLIDRRSYRAAFDRSRAELERARSQSALTASELTRAQTLIDGRAISGEEFDARKAA